MNYIYKCTNTVNGKHYIGYTKDFYQRKQKHKRNMLSGESNTFYAAMRKYGWDKFTWSVIYQSKDDDHCLNVMEPHFIREYNSFYSGYNMTEGGGGTLGATKGTMWINNGQSHRRISKLEKIPEGWNAGRIGLKRTIKMPQKTKNIIGQKNKKHGILAKMNAEKTPCPHCGILLNVGQYNRHIKVKHSLI